MAKRDYYGGQKSAYMKSTARMSARYLKKYRKGKRRMLNRRGLANEETGYVDLASATYPLDTTGSVTLIATVAQGPAVTQRIGKRIRWKSLQLKGALINGSTAVANDIAYFIVYDKRPTGALPTIGDILVSASARAFNNDANSGRFKILKRVDTMLLGNDNAVGNLTEVSDMSQDWYLDLKGLPCAYKAAGTGAIGDIEQGALYLVTVGSSGAGTAAANLVCGFRTRFIDV